MNYTLAKRLKDAGFRQDIATGSSFFTGKDTLAYAISKNPIPITNESVKIPLLEELIEACGDKFIGLTFHGESWSASGVGFPHVSGSIPSDAVANLWLALNKKG